MEKLQSYNAYCEIYNEYDACRMLMSIKEVESAIAEDYAEYFSDCDDGPLARIALAVAEAEKGELTDRAKKNALKAIQTIQKNQEYYQISEKTLEELESTLNREESQASSKSAKAGQPRKRRKGFFCEWNIGDVYAFQLKSKEAHEAGIGNAYCLMRKVASDPMKLRTKNIFPVVICSILDSIDSFKAIEDPQKIGYLKTSFPGRFGSVGTEYRLVLIIPDKQSLEEFGFEYVGNYPSLGIPVDDVDLSVYESIDMTFLDSLEEDICKKYKIHGIKYPEMKFD